MRNYFIIFISLLLSLAGHAAIQSTKVKADVATSFSDEAIWSGAKSETVDLMAQPMIAPRPKTTTTSKMEVQSVHDGKWIAFRMRWADADKSEAGKVDEFSDAVAVQFPVKEGPPPPVFMGMKDQPVHIYHWRAQYQYDKEHGKKEIKDIYPNTSIDMYPMDFKDHGSVGATTPEQKERYSTGKSAGNPQSYNKAGIDEIIAEGFSTSAVIENVLSSAKGQWKNKQWTTVIARPIERKQGSNLKPGEPHYIAFAVWQGGKDEVGSRKSVTMSWVPLEVLK